MVIDRELVPENVSGFQFIYIDLGKHHVQGVRLHPLYTQLASILCLANNVGLIYVWVEYKHSYYNHYSIFL